MNAQHAVLAASLIHEAANSTIDWDAATLDTVGLRLRGLIDALGMTADTRGALLRIGAAAQQAITAIDRRQRFDRASAYQAAEIVGAAETSTIDWDRVTLDTVKLLLRSAAGAIGVRTDTRARLLHVVAICLNAIGAFDRCQGHPRARTMAEYVEPRLRPYQRSSGWEPPAPRSRQPFVEAED